MKVTIQPSTLINNIVTQLPQAMELLIFYQIDFCCAGQRPIQDPIQELDLNEDEVLNKLHTAYSTIGGNINWEMKSYAETIDYIINKHHAFLYQELQDLSKYII